MRAMSSTDDADDLAGQDLLDLRGLLVGCDQEQDRQEQDGKGDRDGKALAGAMNRSSPSGGEGQFFVSAVNTSSRFFVS